MNGVCKKILEKINTQEDSLYDFMYNWVFWVNFENRENDIKNGNILTVEASKERLFQKYKHLSLNVT